MLIGYADLANTLGNQQQRMGRQCGLVGMRTNCSLDILANIMKTETRNDIFKKEG